MKILISGSHGMIGSAVLTFFRQAGHDVFRLVRTNAKQKDEISWDPSTGRFDNSAQLENLDAVVHLAGDPIADGRWDSAKKTRIEQSRLLPTQALASKLTMLNVPPKVFVCASAIGFYGDRGEEILTEKSASGKGFLPSVCRGWEQATESAAQRGIRVVNIRIGIVLSPLGGALKKMLLPFKLGLGGRLGSGTQYMSWVTLDDVVGIIAEAVQNTSLRGPVNAVAPTAVTNQEFTTVMGRLLNRTTIFPVPAFAVRTLFGEMGDALLLAGARVVPEKLQSAGYKFNHPELEEALKHLLH